MSRGEARRLAARLAHDVGKYVARIARNVGEGEPLDGELREMVGRDLFALPGGRASGVFAGLADPLERLAPDDRLAAARRLLDEADRLERPFWEGEAAAGARVAAIAREVEGLLRAVARSLGEAA